MNGRDLFKLKLHDGLWTLLSIKFFIFVLIFCFCRTEHRKVLVFYRKYKFFGGKYDIEYIYLHLYRIYCFHALTCMDMYCFDIS